MGENYIPTNSMMPCHRKLQYDTKAIALMTASRMIRNGGLSLKLYAYKCEYCRLWHLSKQSPKRYRINNNEGD